MASYQNSPLCITPQMTGNSAPSPVVVSAGSEYAVEYAAWHAFSHSPADFWADAYGTPAWLKIDLGSGRAARIGSYTMTERSDANYGAATAWTLSGSNDGSSWTTLDSRVGQTAVMAGEMRTYALAAVSDWFRYFKLNITSVVGPWGPCVAELELLSPPVPTVRTFLLPMRGRARMR